MARIWNEDYETLDRETIKRIQLKRLINVSHYVYEKIPLYKKKFDEKGLKPEDIKSLDDLGKLPFTEKDDFRDNYPFGLFAVPKREIVRIHSSTGTTGKPTVVGYTRNDMNTWTELVARVATAGGVTKDDMVQVAFGYGMFTGGFGLHQGCEHIGASLVPMGGGNTERQLMIMQDFGTTILICTPSYGLYLGELVKELGIKSKLQLRHGLFGGESCSPRARKVIEDDLGIVATDNYGLSELIGPGVSYECLERNGLHISEDHFIPEIIHPQTAEVLPPGSEGELVITALTKEALPVIRYRTRDISILNEEKCGCGRSFVRMCKTTGRTDDMIVLKGVNIFPSQIEGVLTETEGVLPHYQIILDTKDNLDTMEIQMEISERIFNDEMKKMIEVREMLKTRLQSSLGVKVKVTPVEAKTLDRFIGKAVRIIDNRKALK